jgi:quinol monooxygenase YgiN
MLIVAGYMDVEPAAREAFLAGMVAGMTTSRAEPGCLDYVLSPDPIDPGRVRLFERWETNEALGAHLARMAGERSESSASSGPSPVKAVELLQYSIAETGPIGS